jgi:predicted nucleotidyltransferase component of viral defense system
MNAHYLEVARLMARIARNVFADGVFALKGGTAINLFVRDLPRLSVDLDLVFVDHTLPRDQALSAIGTALQAIAERLKKLGLDVPGKKTGAAGDSYLNVRSRDLQVVVEVNEIMRGTLLPAQIRPLQPKAREILGVDLELPVLAESEVYAGKLVAAMDRQHPRDLFDVHHLFAAGGITPEMRRCFVAYLASHNRPVHEILAPILKDISTTFEGGFDGMARDPVELKTLLAARERLISELPKSLSSTERQFLLSLAAAEPDWKLLGFPNLGEMPGPRWKLQNLQTLAKKNPVKFRSQQSKVTELLGV